MVHMIRQCNMILLTLLALAYAYQGVYLLIGLALRFRRERRPEGPKLRYAAVIAGRNEEAVIAGLIGSLRRQHYPRELLDIYVIADNCTDQTAAVARRAGAQVLERFDRAHVGKGYALDWFFHRLQAMGRRYDGYCIFDADNLVDPDFTAEMNRVFATGRYDALTSYRNSKNFGACWISAGYSIWFLREARFLNAVRCALGLNCAISGTGFLISQKLIDENGGWPFHLLTEDIQFSVDCAIRGLRLGYCGTAMVYDEQPVSMGQSWTQRLRWSKGFYQVDAKYGLGLLRGLFAGGRRGFSCYDMLMTVAPSVLVHVALALFNGATLFACLSLPHLLARRVIRELVRTAGLLLADFYIGILLCGAITVASEWKLIRAKGWQKIVYLFTFPIFMLTYIPISLEALVRKVEWKPIRHGQPAKKPQRKAV